MLRKAFGEGKVQALEMVRPRVDFEVLSTIIDRFDIDANCLMTGAIGEPAFIPVPIYTVCASAGDDRSWAGDLMDVCYYAFNLSWIKRRGLDTKMLHIVDVKGDSMEPALSNDDLILLDRSQTTPADGQTFVVRVVDDILVTHVQITGRDKNS